MRSRSVFQKRKHCDFGFLDAAKPFQIQDISESLHRFDISKKYLSASFFEHFNRRLTMFGGETSDLLKAPASLADAGFGDKSVYVKVFRYDNHWEVT